MDAGQLNVRNCDSTGNIPIAKETVGAEESTEQNSRGKNFCIFCNKKQRKHKDRIQPIPTFERNTITSTIVQYASALNDEKLLQKIAEKKLFAVELKYHPLCRLDYQHSFEAVHESKTTPWHIHN